jgi:hypothetical protein
MYICTRKPIVWSIVESAFLPCLAPPKLTLSWMAPLSSLLFVFFEPRVKNKYYGTHKLSRMW